MPIGKYIYGIIPRLRSGQVNSNTHESVGPYGIPACKEAHPVTNTIGAIHDSKICNGAHFIPYQDIAAIVNDAEIVDYTLMFKDALARALVEHQMVIERIMGAGHSIIPMRLGTFAMDEAEVKDILSKGCGLIKEIIPKISDKIEIDVVCIWSDFTSVIKEAGEEKEIYEYKEKLLSSPKGITIDDQMKIGFMVKKALDEKREKYALKIQDILKSAIIDYKQHELMDDKMAANFAFLIDKAKQKEFYMKVEYLNTEFKELLNFKCVGPLPPYSFFTLEIKKMQFNDVDWARRKLGIINDPIAKDEIKKAFHKQAFSFHPDRNPNKPGIDMEFDEITKAYNVLWEYCQGERCSFKEEDFSKNSILVRVR